MSNLARSQIYPFSNETPDLVLSNLSDQRDFYNLTLCSRLLNSLSTPYLYTNITLSSQTSISSFLLNAPTWAFGMCENLELTITNHQDMISVDDLRSQLQSLPNWEQRRSKKFTHLETLIVSFVETEKSKSTMDISGWLTDGLKLILGSEFKGAEFNKIQYLKEDSDRSESEDMFYDLVIDFRNVWTDVILLEAGIIDMCFQSKYKQWIGDLETAEEWRDRVLNL